MSKHADQTALVTGANAGLGFEAAAQLADDGWGTVILACRTLEKAEAARTALAARTGKDPFEVLAIDTSEVASAHAAADVLRDRGVQVDFLLLNAGASGKEIKRNSGGVEITYASTLVGHHVLTMRTLADGTLAPRARIVIAGSEGARGNLPGMPLHDVHGIAEASYGGDQAAAIQALARLETPPQQGGFTNMQEYVTAKLVVAWWAAALSRRLPAGTTVNAVSPGAAPDTRFARDAPLMMRIVMLPLMKVIGPFLGMSGSVAAGARRYLDAASFPDDDTGRFYATAHRSKLVGPMGVQTWPDNFLDEASQEAGFRAVENLTGVPFPARVETAVVTA